MDARGISIENMGSQGPKISPEVNRTLHYQKTPMFGIDPNYSEHFDIDQLPPVFRDYDFDTLDNQHRHVAALALRPLIHGSPIGEPAIAEGPHIRFRRHWFAMSVIRLTSNVHINFRAHPCRMCLSHRLRIG